jgi:uncharacterized coiled-coil DUF342 family protein
MSALERLVDLIINNSILSQSYGGVARQASADLAQLRARNEELEAVHKLTVDECNKATNERNQARKQLQGTREHRDRLNIQCAQLCLENTEAREALENIKTVQFGAFPDANLGEEAAYMRKLASAFLARFPKDGTQ